MPTNEEHKEMCRILEESLDAGGCGWSAQRLPPTGPGGAQLDYDGTAMPTDVMSNETALEFAGGDGDEILSSYFSVENIQESLFQ